MECARLSDTSKTTVEIADVRVLHVHGPASWHDDVTIVGNGPALSALCELISAALAGEPAAGEFTVADGEGYQLTIKLRPAPFGDRAWDNCRLPYSDPIANPPNWDFTEDDL
jgi:hypothetical protein